VVAVAVWTVGKTSNYAVVGAMLHSRGHSHGLHLFIVQLRDIKTHEPLPGINRTAHYEFVFARVEDGVGIFSST